LATKYRIVRVLLSRVEPAHQPSS